MKIKKFKPKRILVIGDILLDRFTFGIVERINPEVPSAPLVKVIEEKFHLGGAANVANNLVSLGAKVVLYGSIGEDLPGEIFKKICKEKKIKLRNFSFSKTIVKQRIVVENNQVTRVDFGENKEYKISEKLETKIINSLRKEIKDFDGIVLSDYSKNFFNKSITQKIIALAKENKILITADPKPKNIDFFIGATLISPNKKEAQEITKINYSKDNIPKMLKSLQKTLNSRYMVITLSEEGSCGYCPIKDELEIIPTIAKKIKDVTGAGDTFIATLTLCMANNFTFKDSLILANKAAGIVVEKIGTSTISKKELFN